MRIDKFLKETGIGSRNDSKKIIKKGLVSVNGNIIKDSDYKVDENNDIVIYDGKTITYQKYIYIMLNKPAGVISATEDYKENTVLDLVKEYKYKDLFPFGRLDKDSVGLLILSNDGKLAHELLSPKKHVMKKYYLRIKGKLDDSDIKAFDEGIVLEDDDKCKSAKLEIIKSDDISECYVYISEGKYHQLKRMFKMVNKEVLYLKRISFGNVTLDENLQEGEYRLLNDEDIKKLQNKY